MHQSNNVYRTYFHLSFFNHCQVEIDMLLLQGCSEVFLDLAIFELLLKIWGQLVCWECDNEWFLHLKATHDFWLVMAVWLDEHLFVHLVDAILVVQLIDLLGSFKPIHDWHAQVEDDQVEELHRVLLESFFHNLESF